MNRGNKKRAFNYCLLLGLDVTKRFGCTVSNRAVSNELTKLASGCKDTVDQAILNALNNKWLVVAMIDYYTSVQSKQRPTNPKASSSTAMCTIAFAAFFYVYLQYPINLLITCNVHQELIFRL